MEVWPTGIDLSFFQGAAFWVAVFFFRGRFGTRFIVGLVLGAMLTRLAWAGLHFSVWLEAPWSLIDQSGGFCVLALPLGPLLVAPCFSAPAAAQAYRASAARALVPALAFARVGCVWLGCCEGRAFMLGLAHPVAAYEGFFWLGVFFVLRKVSDRKAPGLWLVAFGALRLCLEPLRATPALGEPEVEVAWLASFWLGVGLWTLYFDGRGWACASQGVKLEVNRGGLSRQTDSIPRNPFSFVRRLVGSVSCLFS
ncbi:MAG: hypothetical protein VX252_12660 [Myxococcota bacterium]|nr:hypothetical protein [Myxococcota bacterium]